MINATTLGKFPKDTLPFDEQDIKCAALICDVITLETPTGLTAFSEAIGKATVSGQKMGQCQIDVQLEFLGFEVYMGEPLKLFAQFLAVYPLN